MRASLLARAAPVLAALAFLLLAHMPAAIAVRLGLAGRHGIANRAGGAHGKSGDAHGGAGEAAGDSAGHGKEDKNAHEIFLLLA